MSEKNEKLRSEFVEFMNLAPQIPSEESSARVLAGVRKDLGIEPGLLILKVGAAHLAATLAVLYVCPQFGVGWGRSSFSFMNFFMSFGSAACAALCGITLLGSSFFLISLLLKAGESFWLKKRLGWVATGLSLSTLLVFLGLGADVDHWELVMWITFSILGGCALFEVGRRGKFIGHRVLSAR